MSEKTNQDKMIEAVFGDAGKQSAEDVALLLHRGLDALREHIEDVDPDELQARYVATCAAIGGEFMALMQAQARAAQDDGMTLH